jgi:uncharacterized protein (DUF1800 family)
MTEHFPLRFVACCLSLCVLLVGFCPRAHAQALAGAPVLLTEGTGTTTRAVAYEAVTHAPEPFPVTTPLRWSADQRTRIMLFVMNLDLLPGEGANALTADAEDSAGRIYPLRVESLSRPVFVQWGPAPGNPDIQMPHDVPQHWFHAVILRLDDAMTDTLGDVLVRLSLHGVASNRVRVAIGQTGGGPPVDPATEFVAAAPANPPAPTPTPTPKLYGPGEASAADVTRLLEQATWGPSTAEIERVRAIGIRNFLNEQFNAPVANPAKGSNYPDLAFPLDDANQECPGSLSSFDRAICFRDKYEMYQIHRTFFTNALYGQDQLRQRVAFALHQIFVVSGREINRPSWMTVYLQALDRGAFGNFRTLLQDITLNPGMGEYLNLRTSTRTSPNENFAREVLQLFSTGVDELNPDGTPRLDADGNRIPVYTQTTVNEFTRALTGWSFALPLGPGTTNFRDPMTPRGGTTHDTGAKTLLRGATVPACSAANAVCAQQDLTAALDNIFQHPNVGPFIGKQLIQHLVTSNPSPAYVARVAAAFNNDCAGLYPESPCANTRGNMKAVVRAVLLDPEARGPRKTAPDYGKLREPVQLITNVLRAFNPKSFDGTTQSDGVVGQQSERDFPAYLDQPLFLPETVFSYYPPDYEVPGTKLLGPSFGILSTTTALRRANYVDFMLYKGIPVSFSLNNRPRGTSLDLAEAQARISADPSGAQLLDYLDALLLHGTMTPQLRAAVTAAMNTIPLSESAATRRRMQAAIYLVATSANYEVQR